MASYDELQPHPKGQIEGFNLFLIPSKEEEHLQSFWSEEQHPKDHDDP
jgi:hypothetical protein